MKSLSSRQIWRMIIGIGIVLMALLPVFLFYPAPEAVEAQCGSSASSCKNCHEVQGEDPVNAIGEWHTAHAFGDFCEFCHAGNVQAKTQDEAHVGMVDPLSDVKASCQSCHAQDLTERAQIYATALGVTFGTGGTGGGTAATARSRSREGNRAPIARRRAASSTVQNTAPVTPRVMSVRSSTRRGGGLASARQRGAVTQHNGPRDSC